MSSNGISDSYASGSALRIAFVSYEYSSGAGGGGIATYVRQAAAMLGRRGHEVEVFTGSRSATSSTNDGPVVVHKIGPVEPPEFFRVVEQLFRQRHTQRPFDVIESGEYGADASEIVKQFSALPLLVRLHTPTFFISRMNRVRPPLLARARFVLGAVRRGTAPKPYWNLRPRFDREYQFTVGADVIATPSRPLGDIVSAEWKIPRDRIRHLPYPFTPSTELMSLEPPAPRDDVTFTFVGRLERRKGVLTLAEAVPEVVRAVGNVRFVFAGSSCGSPRPGTGMGDYLEDQLAEYRDRVSFLDFVPYERLPAVLSEADICVFPSIWENFPCVCLEAMSAGRAVIGSNAGGMAEMLESGACGSLVPPNDPVALAEAMIALARDREQRLRFGQLARQRVLEAYNEQVVGTEQERLYREAIASAARRQHP
ncbi:MAG TPA: glycosyltransferase family 4 protein [Pirellulales bacterium]|jgi:glycosyltransferase involved in cell wall biosynthesis|nr:glycosyltransferase family 4 protein [Pirellulales bacterium]